MGPGNVLPAPDLCAIPAVFFGQQNMCCIGFDAKLTDVANRRLLLRAGINTGVDRSARPVGNKEYIHAGFSCCRDELDYSRHRLRYMLVIPFFELVVGEWPLERDLEFCIAHDCFIDIEHDGGRKVSCVLLSRLCTPLRVFDKLRKRVGGGLVRLPCDCFILSGMINPKQAQVSFWNMSRRRGSRHSRAS